MIEDLRHPTEAEHLKLWFRTEAEKTSRSDGIANGHGTGAHSCNGVGFWSAQVTLDAEYGTSESLCIVLRCVDW